MSTTTNRIQGSTASPDVKEAMELMRQEYHALAGAGSEGSAGGASASVVADLNMLRDAIVSILEHQDELAAKLNLDAGVTDTNYYAENSVEHAPPPIGTVAVDPASQSGGMS